jgi:hypothetical protein
MGKNLFCQHGEAGNNKYFNAADGLALHSNDDILMPT